MQQLQATKDCVNLWNRIVLQRNPALATKGASSLRLNVKKEIKQKRMVEEYTQEYESQASSMEVNDVVEMSLEDVASHPIIERVARRITEEVTSTSHTAHNSHYSSQS